MGQLLLNLIPYGLAAAVAAPVAIVVGALIIGGSPRPILGGFTFVAGALILDVVVAVIVLAVMEASGAVTGDSEVSAWIDTLLGVLFLVIAIVALVGSDDPAKTEARKERIKRTIAGGLGPILVLGVGVQVVNSDALAIMASGCKEIAVANGSIGEQAVALAWLLALMLSVYYAPIVLRIAAPQHAARWLGSFSEWVLDNARMIEIVTGFAIGGLFFIKGVAAL